MASLSPKEKQIRQKLKDDFEHYASKCLKIRSKSGEIKPFVLNYAQKYLHEKVQLQRSLTGKIRCIICKGRQEGISTYIEGRFYWRVTHQFGTRAFILTHDTEATNNLFEMAKRYHENCPVLVRPEIQASNAKELIFGQLDSGYKLGTAGNKAVGRSSTIQLLHGSEVAYWPNAAEHAKGILQAVPNEAGTEVFIESTARGVGNYFHEQWQMAEAGISEFIAIFIPWYWQLEYTKSSPLDFCLTEEEIELQLAYKLTNDQLCWRRYKIVELSVGGIDGLKAFQQEYPNNPIEAFQHSGDDSFILSNDLIVPRRTECEAYGPLVIGVDPARYGDDRSSIIRRRGRVAYKLQSFIKKNTMEIVGIVHNIICEEQPTKVCIDVIGLGAGIVDRLIELGHKQIIVPVNAANIALNEKIYTNKRAEMWGVMKEWLLDGPVQIPDSDSLHADLCGILYTFDSKGRLVLEKKETMKKRGIRSPDEADALALTFALPDIGLLASKKKENEQVAKKVLSGYNSLTRLRKKAYGPSTR